VSTASVDGTMSDVIVRIQTSQGLWDCFAIAAVPAPTA
jgi:hypothetical protein